MSVIFPNLFALQNTRSVLPQSVQRNTSICCNRQAGFSLVSGIFILVVLATLGVFMVTNSALYQTSSALDVVGSRVYHAARSGIEWGAYQVTNNTPYAQSCVAATNSQSITLAGTLSTSTVTVACNAFVELEAGATVTLYQITSTATHGLINSSTYVERQIQATMER